MGFQFGTDNLYDFGVTMMAMMENDQESKVQDMLNYLEEQYGDTPIEKEIVDQTLEDFDILYDLLPQYLKDEIDDNIDVIV